MKPNLDLISCLGVLLAAYPQAQIPRCDDVAVVSIPVAGVSISIVFFRHHAGDYASIVPHKREVDPSTAWGDYLKTKGLNEWEFLDCLIAALKEKSFEVARIEGDYREQTIYAAALYAVAVHLETYHGREAIE